MPEPSLGREPLPLHPRGAVGVPEGVGLEGEPKTLGEGLHLGRRDGVLARTAGEDDGAVVDHAAVCQGTEGLEGLYGGPEEIVAPPVDVSNVAAPTCVHEVPPSVDLRTPQP